MPMKIIFKWILVPIVIASLMLLCCNEGSDIATKDNEDDLYRVTIFVSEVLDDGTISYARTYVTNSKPKIVFNSGVIFLENGITTNAPYVIERTNKEELK